MNIREYLIDNEEKAVNTTNQSATTQQSEEPAPQVSNAQPTTSGDKAGNIEQYSSQKEQSIPHVAYPEDTESGETDTTEYTEPAYAASHRNQRTRLSYREMYDLMHPAEDPELEKKRKKRERTNKIIAAIGDGLGAISNLVTVSKGANNVHDSKADISPKLQARYDALEKRREASKQAEMSGRMNAERLDREAEYKDRSLGVKEDGVQVAKSRVGVQQEGNKIKKEANEARQAETNRHNDATEKETNRHNTAVEQETHDNNVAMQGIRREANSIAGTNAGANVTRANKYQGGGGSHGSKGGKSNMPKIVTKTTTVGGREIGRETTITKPYVDPHKSSQKSTKKQKVGRNVKSWLKKKK